MEKSMEKLSLTEKLEFIKTKMQELEKAHGISFPSSFEFDGFEKTYGGTKQQDQQISKMNNELLSSVLKKCDFTKSTNVVPDEAYNALPQNTNTVLEFDELYHGARRIKNQANVLFDENYHTGLGSLCDGIYTTPNMAVAFSYTRSDDFSKNNPLILSLKLPNASVANIDSLSAVLERTLKNTLELDETTPQEIKEFASFASTLPAGQKEKYLCALKANVSIFATVLGYDCVVDKTFPSVILLNRGKLVISESEANKIKQALASYQASQPEK